MTQGPSPRKRPVRRDEGEVQSWPRGFVAYVPAGPDDSGPPSEEEERTAQRIRLAGRLIGVLRARGDDDPSWISQLRSAERTYREGDRAGAARRIDALLGELGARVEPPRPDSPGTGHP